MKSALSLLGLGLAGCASSPTLAPSPHPVSTVPASPVSLRSVEAAPELLHESSPAEFRPSAEDVAAWSRARTLLDYNARARFGGGQLSTGFAPDPWTFPFTVGGGRNPINAGDLGIRDGVSGERCGRSFVTRRPDFHFTFAEASTFRLLRFYVVTEGNSDVTLVINEPGGRWRCNDDHRREAWGHRLMPAIDFANPSPGRYDVWVGTYEASLRNAATLHVTELDSNHP